jgi:hypothetical protein
MAKIGVVRKSKKQQALDAELGLIIDEMGRAMWSADKQHMADSKSDRTMSLNMLLALYKFADFCKEHYGQKA